MNKPKQTIPSGWTQAKVSDICQVISGSTPKTNVSENWDGDLVWVTPNDLSKQKAKYVSNSERKITTAGLRNASLTSLPLNTVIMSSRAPIGYLAINKTIATINQGCKAFVCNNEIDSEFLYYFLQGNMDTVKSFGAGSTFAEVGKKALENLKVILPPKSEQQKIAEILSTVDEDIEKIDRVIGGTENLKRGLLRNLLTKGIGHTKFKKTKLGEIPKDWNMEELGKVALINPSTKLVISNDTPVGFITMADVSNDAKVENVQERKLSQVKKGYTQFLANDVLFAKITPCMENGKGGVCPDLGYKIYSGSTEFHILRESNKICSEFIHYTVNQKDFRALAERYMTGSAGQKRVQKEFLESYKIALPPIDEQKQITKILSMVDEKITTNKQLKEKLIVLKKGLMSDLLTARVRV